jgi:hypothetical protein
MDAMMDDYESGSGTVSRLERISCEAHALLTGYLQSGEVTAWASVVSFPSDDAFDSGRGEDEGWEVITKDHLRACRLDYAKDRAVSIHSGEFWRGHIAFSARWELAEIRVDERELQEALALNPRLSEGLAQSDTPRIRLWEADGNWSVSLNGQGIELGPVPGASVERGLRSVELLLRYRRRPISFYLLEGLARKPGHTKQKEPAKTQKLDQLQAVTTRIARHLYETAGDLDEAQSQLKAAIVAIEFPGKEKFGAGWWDKTLGVGKSSMKTPDSFKGVAEKTRHSINQAINFIDAPHGIYAAEGNRATIARYLHEHIKLAGKSAIFD